MSFLSLEQASALEVKDELVTTAVSTTYTPTGVVAGKGIYVELVSTTSSISKVTQLLFTPEYLEAVSGVHTPFALHSRTISALTPRKQWRVSFPNSPTGLAILKGEVVKPEQSELTKVANEMADRFIRSVEHFLKSYTSEGFTIRNKPIVVEVTDFDLVEVREFKTPIALQRRIQKARVALAFPEKLV